MPTFIPSTGSNQSSSIKRDNKDRTNSDVSLKTIENDAASSNASMKVQPGSKAVSVKSGNSSGQNAGQKR